MPEAPNQPAVTLWDKVRSVILWSIGAPVFFFCSGVVLVATYLRPPRQLQRVMGVCTWIIPRSVGFRFRYVGLQHIPRDRSCVWIANHVNNFDPMPLLSISPNYIIALETEKHFRWPIYGRMIKRWGNLPISKGNSEATMRSLDLAVERLQDGINLMVFPEGTRSRSGGLGRFRRGAFVVALRARAPILPIALRGAYEAWGAGLIVHPGEIVVEFLPLIEVTDYRETQGEELSRLTRTRIAEALQQPLDSRSVAGQGETQGPEKTPPG